MRIAIVGLGKFVTALVAQCVSKGHTVTGCDDVEFDTTVVTRPRPNARNVNGAVSTRTATRRPAGLMISWAPESSHSAELARTLGIHCYFIHMFAFQRPLVSPFKYPLQTVTTWYILWRQRPRAVIVQNPPLPAVLCVALYSRLNRARFVIDSHSSALVDKKWAWSRPAQRWLGRHAAATLIHTVTLRDRVKGAGRVMVQESPPLARSGGTQDIPQRVMPEVVVISSFAGDEPVAETLAAAASMPDVQFVFTGNPERAGNPQLLRALPPNVRLFGWQSYDGYIALLRSTNVALCLTTRNLTLLRGAWEAVYVGQPLVTSGWPVQRDCFVRGTIFVDNNAASIAVGVRDALRNEASLRAEMRCLAEEKRSAWNTALQTLRDVLALPAAAVVDG